MPEKPPEEKREAFSSASLLAELQGFASLISLLAAEGLEIQDIEDERKKIILVQIRIFEGDLEAAEQGIRRILDEDEFNRDALFYQAIVADVKQDFPRARRSLENLLQQYPDDLGALSFLGEILLQQEEDDEAENLFLRSLAIEKNYIAYRGLGHLYMKKKNHPAAENMFTEAIALNETDSFLYSDRALARALQNATRPALADINRAIELLPDYAWNYLDKGKILMEQKDFEEAAEAFTEFLEREDVFIGHVYRGQAYEFSEKFLAALADYQQAVQKQPEYTPVFASLAITAYQLREYDLAAEYFLKAFRHGQTQFFEYVLMAGASLLWLDKTEEAKTVLESALKTVRPADIFFHLMRLYLDSERADLTLSRIRKIEDPVDAVKGRIYLGIWHDIHQEETVAKKLYEEGIQKDTAGLFETRIARRRLEYLRQ